MKKIIKSKINDQFEFKQLEARDSVQLGHFFESLSKNTLSRFGPHPLTKEHAATLCKNIGRDNVNRFIILNSEGIIGYFILDYNTFENEIARYKKFGVILDSKIDPVFAPCIADNYQNQGIATQAMEIILDFAKKNNLRSIVLMGGTQEPNLLARNFYKKFGFKDYDKFYTVYNGLNNIDMMLRLKRT